MKLFSNMDLYKGIILASLVLVPGAGGWVYWLNDQIEETRVALKEASKQTLEIGSLEKQMETVVTNTQKNLVQTDSPNEYFSKMIVSSVAGGGISPDDFTFEPNLRETQVQVGKGKAMDTEVGIIFGKQGSGRGDFKLSRDYLFALIYNVEQQQIWKLRTLDMVNGTNERDFNSQKTPPAEIEDKWIVKFMRFVKRKPAK